jgi:hypothetical protein
MYYTKTLFGQVGFAKCHSPTKDSIKVIGLIEQTLKLDILIFVNVGNSAI